MIILTELHSGKKVAIPAGSVISVFSAGAGDCAFCIVNFMQGAPHIQGRIHVLEGIEQIVSQMELYLGDIEDI